MKKILVLFVTFSILLTTVTTVMAPARQDYQPGASYIGCYCTTEYYNYPSFSLAYEEIAYYDIPFDICPTVNYYQIGMVQLGNNIEDDSGVRYLCTLISSSDEDCRSGPRFLIVSADDNFRLYFYDGENNQVDDYEGQSYYDVLINPDAVRFEVSNSTSTHSITGSAEIYKNCCYDCRKVQEPPAKILYPKVDIETFSVSGGPTVIKDGKVISNFNIVPGIQTVMIQLENRGFFTQKDSMIRFEGIPEGITVNVSPPTQVIKAQNIGTYEATFTVGPNVPSGTYTITMIAYTPKGVLDKIEFKIVVP